MDKKTEHSLSGQIDVLSIVKDILRQWWVILILSISASLFANIWVSLNYQPVYTVKSTFVVTARGMNANVYQNLSSAKELAEQFSRVLESNVLKRKVAEELGMESFTANTSVEIVPESNLMELTVEAGSAMEAYHVMKSIMNNYSSVSDYVIANVILEVIQNPVIPVSPSNPLDTKSVMGKAFLIAAAVLTAIFAMLSYMKDTVKNEREVREKIDTKLLGSIYHEKKAKFFRRMKKVKTLTMLINNPMLSFRFVESNRMMASRVRSYLHKYGHKVLLITSVMENEGKSTVAANLALALAQENKNVLLIDCDFRKPAQYKIFAADERDIVDLPKILETRSGLNSMVRRYKSTSLYTIFNETTTKHLEELLEKGTLQKMLTFFREKMDYIILDTSPMALVSDTEELANLSDATALVVRQDMVLAKDINDAIDVLNETNGKVLGCIFNDVSTGITERISRYGYGGYYGYGGHYGKRAK